MRKVVLYLVLFLFINVYKTHAQFGVDGVNYQMRYNADSCWYDVYLIINEGEATALIERIQFYSQISLVVPTGSTVTIPRGYMPLINNTVPGTGTYAPNYWILSSSINNPAAAPGKDFKSITPVLSAGIASYNNLVKGDEIKLFSVRVTPFPICGKDIRLYINGQDPSTSEAGMGGVDFTNEFTIQSAANQVYDQNSNQVFPADTFIIGEPKLIFNQNELSIDITTTTTTCQAPLVYSWTGPAGYTGNAEDVYISPVTSSNNGTYKLLVHDALGCKDSVEIRTSDKPQAGPDQITCAGSSIQVQGTSPSTGIWVGLPSNPAGSTISTSSNGQANISFNQSASGIYFYKYETSTNSDTMQVTVITLPAVSMKDSMICLNMHTTLTSNQNGTWQSNDTAIATVASGGLVKGISPGSVNFTFINSMTGCINTTTDLVVHPIPNTTLVGSDSICIGKTTAFIPSSGGTWQSNNNSVASISNSGIVTSISPGTTTMTFTADISGCVSLPTSPITVLPKIITNIVGPNKIKIGSTTQLVSNTPGRWVSSNNAIATIDATTGLVTGVSNGTVQFLLTSDKGCFSDLVTIVVEGINYQIKGFCFTDINANGIFDHAIDFPLPNVNINIEDDSITYYSNVNGYFNITVDSGAIVMNNYINFGNWVSDSITRNLNIINPTTYVFVGFVPSSNGNNVSGIATASSSKAICKSFANLYAQAFNASSDLIDGYLIVEYDPRTYISNASPLPSGGQGNYLVWTFSDLPPGRIFSPDIEYGVPDAISNTDSLHFNVRMVNVSTGDTLSIFNLSENIVCNGNENEALIRTWPDRAGDDNYTLIGEAINYNAVFTNNGTGIARSATISCSIDEHLDFSTLKILKASHNFDVISVNGKLLFSADSLALVPSNRDGESEMYVSFSLLPYGNIAEKTIIYMNAEVSMDNGYENRSPTVINTIVSQLPCDLINDEIIQVGNTLSVTNQGSQYAWYDCQSGNLISTSEKLTLSSNGSYYCIIDGLNCRSQTNCFEFIFTSTKEAELRQSLLYPNPANDILNVETASHSVFCTIEDFFGRKLLQSSEKNISIKSLTTGVYFIRIQSDGYEIVKKFFKL